MRSENKHRLTCFYELYGYNLDFFDVGTFQLNAYRVSNGLGPRLQFLWLPLDVNNLLDMGSGLFSEK